MQRGFFFKCYVIKYKNVFMVIYLKVQSISRNRNAVEVHPIIQIMKWFTSAVVADFESCWNPFRIVVKGLKIRLS